MPSGRVSGPIRRSRERPSDPATRSSGIDVSTTGSSAPTVRTRAVTARVTARAARRPSRPPRRPGTAAGRAAGRSGPARTRRSPAGSASRPRTAAAGCGGRVVRVVLAPKRSSALALQLPPARPGPAARSTAGWPTPRSAIRAGGVAQYCWAVSSDTRTTGPRTCTCRCSAIHGKVAAARGLACRSRLLSEVRFV